jgi:hypothetical protein
MLALALFGFMVLLVFAAINAANAGQKMADEMAERAYQKTVNDFRACGFDMPEARAHELMVEVGYYLPDLDVLIPLWLHDEARESRAASAYAHMT